jgi:putative oxidoreductase
MISYRESRGGRLLALVLRLILGAIFVYAAWSKLRDPWALFAVAIDSYQVLPQWAVELVARTLPWFELLIGLLLIAGRWLVFSSTIASGLLLLFFGLMVRAHLQGLEINCGCFGVGEAISWKTFLRDGAMLAGSLLLTAMSFLDRRKRARAHLPEPEPHAVLRGEPPR